MASKSAIDILKRILLSFRRHWGLKLISLLFALILWNYVIMEIDPYTTKTFNVAVTNIGLQQLKNNNLTIKGNAKDVKSVEVVVQLRRSEAASFNGNNIQVTADFSNITHEGKADIILKPSTSRATVSAKSVTPPRITMEIENRAKRIVPVSCDIASDIPLGYWRSEPEYTKTLEITGASSDIRNIAYAKVVFDLTNQTQSLARTLDYTLYDSDNNVIMDTAGLEFSNNGIFNITILPTKTVPIDAQGSLIGEVARGYQVVSAVSDPGSIIIAGSEKDLKKIDSLKTTTINIDGAAGTLGFTAEVKLPSGVRVAVPGSDTVEVAVTVAEKTATKTLEHQRVSITGLGTGLRVDTYFYVDAVITYPELITSSIRPSKLHLFADATGLEAGAHTLTVFYEWADDIDASKIKVELNPVGIAVQIKAAVAP